METNRTIKVVRSFATLALTLCFIAQPASAQPAFEGKFSLAHETQWGPVTLMPGDYSFTLSSQSANGIVVVRDDESGNPAGIILTGSCENQVSSANSDLVLARSGGKTVVRSMELKEIGMTFRYAMPKAGRQIFAQGPILFQRVPVSINGK